MLRNLVVIAGLAAAGTATAGCRASEYFLDRARDLGDVVRLQVGFGPGIGVNAKVAGTVQAGLVVASVPRRYQVGVDYGTPAGLLSAEDRQRVDHATLGSYWDGEVSWSLLGPWMAPGIARGARLPTEPHKRRSFFLGTFGYWETRGAPEVTVTRRYQSRCGWMMFDGLLGRARVPGGHGPVGDQARIWSGRALRTRRRAAVHAFDCEASVYAGLVYVKAGISPGEIVDFLLGFLGADIAGDDGRQ